MYRPRRLEGDPKAVDLRQPRATRLGRVPPRASPEARRAKRPTRDEGRHASALSPARAPRCGEREPRAFFHALTSASVPVTRDAAHRRPPRRRPREHRQVARAAAPQAQRAPADAVLAARLAPARPVAHTGRRRWPARAPGPLVREADPGLVLGCVAYAIQDRRLAWEGVGQVVLEGCVLFDRQ